MLEVLRWMYPLLEARFYHFKDISSLEASILRAGMRLLAGTEIVYIHARAIQMRLAPEEVTTLKRLWEIISIDHSGSTTQAEATSVEGGILREIRALLQATRIKCVDTRLSEREWDVLYHISNGSGNKEIAEILAITVRAVEERRAKIRRKLDLHTIPDLTRFALLAGITDLDTLRPAQKLEAAA